MISLKNVKRYCKDYEKIENYAQAVADTTEMWVCHHIMEEVFTYKELKNAGWYYDRPASELIFIRQSEHQSNASLHIGLKRRNADMVGKKYKPRSEETKKKIADAKPKRYILCIETNEIHYYNEWVRLGYTHVHDAASGKIKSTKGLHFTFVD